MYLRISRKFFALAAIIPGSDRRNAHNAVVTSYGGMVIGMSFLTALMPRFFCGDGAVLNAPAFLSVVQKTIAAVFKPRPQPSDQFCPIVYNMADGRPGLVMGDAGIGFRH